MQGFLMQRGLHYNDVHALVPAVTTFRVFMMQVVIASLDDKTAFLATPRDCNTRTS